MPCVPSPRGENKRSGRARGPTAPRESARCLLLLAAGGAALAALQVLLEAAGGLEGHRGGLRNLDGLLGLGVDARARGAHLAGEGAEPRVGETPVRLERVLDPLEDLLDDHAYGLLGDLSFREVLGAVDLVNKVGLGHGVCPPPGRGVTRLGL